MSEMDVDEQKELLRQNGWIAIGEKPLGEGGGARVFKVVSSEVATRFVNPLLCPPYSDNAKPLSLEMAQTIAEIAEGEVTTIAAGKVARIVGHRMKREIEILRDVQHPN